MTKWISGTGWGISGLWGSTVMSEDNRKTKRRYRKRRRYFWPGDQQIPRDRPQRSGGGAGH